MLFVLEQWCLSVFKVWPKDRSVDHDCPYQFPSGCCRGLFTRGQAVCSWWVWWTAVHQRCRELRPYCQWMDKGTCTFSLYDFIYFFFQLVFRVNSFGAKFQTTFVVCFFFILTNYLLERCLYVKLKDWMSNSVDPD